VDISGVGYIYMGITVNSKNEHRRIEDQRDKKESKIGSILWMDSQCALSLLIS